MDNLAKLDKWNAVKKSIDTQNFKKQVEIQSIYWISIGQNVGSEVFGKSGIFTRPVLVINVFFNGTFFRRAAFKQGAKQKRQILS